MNNIGRIVTVSLDIGMGKNLTFVQIGNSLESENGMFFNKGSFNGF